MTGTRPHTYVFGISGRVGGLLAEKLRARGITVRGLTRDSERRRDLAELGIETDIGQLGELGVLELSEMMAGSNVVVFAAGSNGGPRDVTSAIDSAALARVSEAATDARVSRVVLLSVMPEAWRGRGLGDDEEHYFAVKKAAEVSLVHTALDWTILRPSLLTDDPASDAVALSPAEAHDSISRADVAATLAELVVDERFGRRILELNRGTLSVAAAVSAAATSFYS